MNVRKAAVAGYFYDNNPAKLKTEIDTMLTISRPSLNIKNIFGIIVPHAGYIYSGRTAAFAFNLLKDKGIKNVIIISPSHRVLFQGSSVYDGDAYETPLGIIPVNKELAGMIASEESSVQLSSYGHDKEHAIEVELPFLQQVLSDFSIVPIVIGDQSWKYVEDLAARIAAAKADDTIVVASSDLSHYHDHNNADKLDSILEEKLSEMDINGLRENLKRGNCEACGEGAILAILKAAEISGNKKVVVLNRTDSSEASGDTKSVVGYLSAVLYEE